LPLKNTRLTPGARVACVKMCELQPSDKSDGTTHAWPERNSLDIAKLYIRERCGSLYHQIVPQKRQKV
jgi:hypothetical protein